MRFLIVVPRYKDFGLYYELPLGLGYISSSLKKAGFETRVVNLNHDKRDVPTILQGEVKKGDVVCTGGLSVHYPQIEEIFNSIPKGVEVTKLCGGGIITSEPTLIKDALNLDVAIVGEGEGPIVDWATRGVAEPSITEIDIIPYPDFKGLGVKFWLGRQRCFDEHYLYVEDYPRAMPILSSRGCPYQCTFCFSPLGKKYRQRSLDNFFTEVDFLCSNYNINILTILDETIGVNPARLIDICRMMKRFKLKWMTQMRVDLVNKDILKLMKESGCFQISYGIESASQKVLDSMKKKITVKQITDALTWTREEKIGIQGGIIFGDPAETLETFAESIEWNMEHKDFTLNLMSVSAYPGSELYEKHVKKAISEEERLNWIKEGCPGYFNVSTLGRAKIDAILKSIQIDNLTRFYLVGEVLNAEQIGYDEHRGAIMKMEWRCPHCNEVNVYTNTIAMEFLLSRPPRLAIGTKIGCRKCNGRASQMQWCEAKAAELRLPVDRPLIPSDVLPRKQRLVNWDTEGVPRLQKPEEK